MATSVSTLLCDTCKENQEYTDAEVLCKECRELYCSNCLMRHKTFKATKDHVIVRLDQSEKNSTVNCDTCYEAGEGTILALSLCEDCREFYCNPCKQRHATFKATKNHVIYPITDSKMVSAPVSADSLKAPLASAETFSLSSDFEAFTITPTDKEILGAQIPVLQVNQTKQRHSGSYLGREELDKISVESVTTFNGKIETDSKSCVFNGIICLNDGRIVLLDKNNKKLKMFNPNFQLVCAESTKVKCLGMTKVADNEIAVVTEGKSVDFYTIRNNNFIRKEKGLKLDARGFSISHKESLYAVACNIVDKDPFIKICSSSGQELRRITSFKERPGYIVNLDSESECLYISSWKENKFSCLSHTGDLKWEMSFGGEDVAEIFNCLVVSSRINHAVVLCTKDGKYRKILVKDKEILSSPYYMSYNCSTQQLFVTSFQSKNDAIITVINLAF